MPATNSKGWEVQRYSEGSGWEGLDVPYPTPSEAEDAMAWMVLADQWQRLPNQKYRVYEALT